MNHLPGKVIHIEDSEEPAAPEVQNQFFEAMQEHLEGKATPPMFVKDEPPAEDHKKAAAGDKED